jgi:hypothetical protein
MGIIRTLLTLLILHVVSDAQAQDVRAKTEAEGKLMMYATFTAADSKTLLDGFKQVYPKIDATYYRSNDAALMERFVNENRAGQNLCDVMITTSFYGNNIKKRGLFAPYDSPERKFFREGYGQPQRISADRVQLFLALRMPTRVCSQTQGSEGSPGLARAAAINGRL